MHHQSAETRKFVHDLIVVRNIPLNRRHFILELRVPGDFPQFRPGQFVQVRVDDSPATFLRRPLSVHSVDPASNSFRLLVQIKGEGTKHLALLEEGDPLNVIYPLGNTFSPPSGSRILLVGGGCGVAPLLFLAQHLNGQGYRPAILTGWKSREDIFERSEYETAGELLITTEDGSEGEKGLVTDHSVFQKETIGYDCIYCCGPEPMMRSVAAIAEMHNIPCEVSLENLMACGFGVCLCCVTPTQHGNQRVCMEGPVFNSTELKWQGKSSCKL